MSEFVVVLLSVAAIVHAQQPKPIAVHTLAPAQATSVEPIGAIYGLRELPGGRVLVSDGRGHRLMVFDSTLASFTLSADSAGASGNTYPRYALYGLFPYVGDSTLFVDPESHTFLVIGPRGGIVRAMAPARASDLLNMNAEFASAAGVDAHGQFIYRGANPLQPRPPAPGAPPLPVSTHDDDSERKADRHTAGEPRARCGR